VGCDEEACCPCFWQDEGVPPLPLFRWVFSRANPHLNDNPFAEAFGHCGMREADRERKVLMGIALAFTLASIVLTTFGCLSLSTDPKLVRTVPWAIGHVVDRERGEGTVVFMGLARLVVKRCVEVEEGEDWHTWGACELEPHWWSEVPARCTGNSSNSSRPDFYYPCEVLLGCAAQTRGNRFGAFVTCATLIFAMIGCLTRIRRRADSNFQKIVGTFPDLLGIITLSASLVAFSAQCTSKMPAGESDPSMGFGQEAGAGYNAYCFCLFAAVVRVSIHIVMPVPGAGVSAPCAPGDRSRLLSSKSGILGEPTLSRPSSRAKTAELSAVTPRSW